MIGYKIVISKFDWLTHNDNRFLLFSLGARALDPRGFFKREVISKFDWLKNRHE